MNHIIFRDAWRNAAGYLAGRIHKLKTIYNSAGPAVCAKAAVDYSLTSFRQRVFDYYVPVLWTKKYFGGEFTFDGCSFKYLYHGYNATWRNERAVEIPIVWAEVQKHDPKQVLEVGNVLAHYYSLRHCVLDKYDMGAELNMDVTEFRLEKKFDLIVSVSTIEHIDFDEQMYTRSYGAAPYTNFYEYTYAGSYDARQSAKKIKLAIVNLKNHLSANGTLLITAPLGYNPAFDDVLKKENLFTSIRYLKRISRSNKWIETGEEGIRQAKYSAFGGANELALCFFEPSAM